MRARSQVSDVDVTAVASWRSRAQTTVLDRCDAHDPAEGLERNSDVVGEDALLLDQVVMVEIRLLEFVAEQTKAWNDAVPAPAFVAKRHHLDLKRVARRSTFQPH